MDDAQISGDLSRVLFTKDEIAHWREDDPIPDFERKAVEAGLLTDEQVTEIRAQVMERMRDAVRAANSAPDADPADLLTAVFATA